MSVTIKSSREIENMRVSNHLLQQVFCEVEKMIKPGISTYDIDREAEKKIRSLGGVPNFLNYSGYPASVCASVNEEVVHGIPNRSKILKDGDIISIDMGLIYNGYHSDCARTYAVGTISPEAQKLIDVTRQSFFEGMKFAKAGNYLHQISKAIGNYAESFGYGVIRDLCGHGIGTHMHEDPMIPNFAQKTNGIRLQAGMTLAIEPMIAAGTWEVDWMDDGWTVVTADGSLAAHYENTILITEGEPEILTLRDDEVRI
ncbi:MAG: type I methionyl aminopeptidase [Eubacteriales bacterium]|nr:type I methionyl aminopeptidase [Eubacteriales bacterium]